MAIYFAGKIGETVVGFMLIVIVLSGVTGGFVGGFFSDKLGRKKMMIIADAVTCLMFLCIAFVNSPWVDLPYVTFLLFVVTMFASGIMAPVARAMIIDVSSPDNRKFVFTLSYWAMNLAHALGAGIGAFLFKDYHFELFLGVSGVSLISLVITIFFIAESYFPEEPRSNTNREKKESGGLVEIFSSYGAVLKDHLFIVYVIAGVLLFSLESQLTNYIGVRLGKEVPTQVLFSLGSFDFSVDGIKMLGFLQTENTLFVVAFTIMIGLLMKRFSDHWVLYAGIGLFTIGYFALGMSVNPWVLFAAMFVVSTGEVMYVPVIEAALADIAPEDKRSTYMAANGLTGYGAMMIAALFVTLGAWLPFWLIGIFFVVMGGSSLFLFHRIMPGLKERRAMQKGA